MTLFNNKYRIESARLPGWDYSCPGYYFVTVCTHDRGHLFGEIVNGEMRLTAFGEIVADEWVKSFEIRRELLPDEFVVMPNHFHGIVRLVATVDPVSGPPVAAAVPVETSGRTSLRGDVRQPANRLRPKSVSSFMAGVKSVITKRINIIRQTPGAAVLQPRFHDHIIRNEQELYRIRQYIKNNPTNWERDRWR